MVCAMMPLRLRFCLSICFVVYICVIRENKRKANNVRSKDFLFVINKICGDEQKRNTAPLVGLEHSTLCSISLTFVTGNKLFRITKFLWLKHQQHERQKERFNLIYIFITRVLSFSLQFTLFYANISSPKGVGFLEFYCKTRARTHTSSHMYDESKEFRISSFDKRIQKKNYVEKMC